MATAISRQPGTCPRASGRPLLACILTGFLAATITSFADQPDFAGQARAAYGEAAKAYHESPLAAGLAWKFARACYDVADYATNNTERAAFAEEGITACRNLISKDPRSVSAHYYLGMNLAQLARTKGIAALKIVNQMRDQFVLAQELDPAFDHAGPDRNLGLLYHEAPSWISIGNRSKSHHHLQAAVDIAPDYPENHLNLAEACLAWGDRNGAKREFKALEMIWETAHATYSGVLWASSWLDWERRFAQLKNKIAEPSRAIESPRRSE